jgi:hypothetical protein
MATQPDLVLYDRDGRKTAIVQISNKRGTTGNWASQFRRNIAAYRKLGSAEFFLLVTPDRLYLWRGVGDDPALVPPHYEADGRGAFAPYVRRAGLDPEQLSANAFELIVTSWLSEGILQWDTHTTERDALQGSGFFEAIKNGRIDYQIAA